VVLVIGYEGAARSSVDREVDVDCNCTLHRVTENGAKTGVRRGRRGGEAGTGSVEVSGKGAGQIKAEELGSPLSRGAGVVTYSTVCRCGHTVRLAGRGRPRITSITYYLVHIVLYLVQYLAQYDAKDKSLPGSRLSNGPRRPLTRR
jgi:hypothetical protein